MTRINDIFTTCRAKGRAALMPFLVGGYPSLDDLGPAIVALEEAGADIVEVGIPFSDPIADGPVIAHAMHEALEQHVTPPAVFERIASMRKSVKLGIIAMVSDSIVMRMGPERFVADAARAGVDGLIVPDLDASDARELNDLVSQRGMTLSMLIAPTSTSKRIAALLPSCTGFVYLLARAGITGERDAAPEIKDRLTLLRGMTDLPVAVGFGISKPEHIAAVVSQGADAAIVGSAVIRAMGDAAATNKPPAEAAANLVRALATGLAARQPV